MVTAIPRLFLAIGFCSAIGSCAAPNPPYRTTQMSAAICANEHALAASNYELSSRASGRDLTREDLKTLRKCPKQKHLLPDVDAPQIMLVSAASEESGDQPDNDWTRLASNAGRPGGLPFSDSYHLAFVEVEETKNDLNTRQSQIVTGHLDRLDKAGVQNVVVLYVHGWRHDAALRDGDVRKFRRVLGYTRAALNTRCIDNGSYCNAQVTGIFAAWRGRNFDEGETETNADRGVGGGIGALGPILSFWNRFDRSECLGQWRRSCGGDAPTRSLSPLRDLIEDVEGELRLKPGNPKADKLMVVGHSMGGNILATMLRDDAVDKVARHRVGREMTPLAGDLVVLINPASRAENWSNIQLQERKRAGFTPEDNRISCISSDPDVLSTCQQDDRDRLQRWHTLYPATQRPIYVSLTATQGWGTLRNTNREVEYDTATGRIFPISQDVIGIDRRDGQIALGHQLPEYANNRSLKGRAVGTSHEMAVLEGAQTDEGKRYGSRYASTMTAEAAWCAPADGWLLRARTDDQGRPVARNISWDHGYVPLDNEGNRISTRNVGGAFNRAAVQWRQAIYPAGQSRHLSVSPWTTPFWNTRALDSAIRGHAGWANYATWCALNQLVLDDVTRPSEAPEVEQALADGKPVQPHAAIQIAQ